MTLAVTGSTGRLGGRVARLLSEAGFAQRLLVRDVARAPKLPGAVAVRSSYDEPDIGKGATVLFVVSAAEHPDRIGQHLRFVEAARAAGVEHVVYTSFLGASADATFTLARHHWATEQALLESGMRWTFLRDSLYADFFSLMTGVDGVLRGPAGQGRVGAVAIADVADAAVAVIRDPDIHAEQTYDLTGPELLSLAEVAQVLTAHGRPTTYLAETVEEAYASRSSYDAPEWEVEGWVTSYQAIADGSMAVVSDHVETLTGHAPRALAELL